jgi:hypothetical protein
MRKRLNGTFLKQVLRYYVPTSNQLAKYIKKYKHLWECQYQNKLHDFSPHANYTDRATAACRRS